MKRSLPPQLMENCKLHLSGEFANIGSGSMVSAPLYSDPNLVRFYSMNSLSEKNGFDFTNSGCTLVEGKFGNAYSSGANNPSNGMYNTTNVGIDGGAVTVTAWIKTLSNHMGNHAYNFAVWESSNVAWVANGITFNQDNTAVSFVRLRSYVAWQGPTVAFNATPGTWNHYAVSYDGSTVRGYINGNLVATGGASGNGTEDLLRATGVGIGNNVFSLNQDTSSVAVDELAVFNRVLSDAEIKEIAGYAAFVDASGSGNHGTYEGVVTSTRGRSYGFKSIVFNGSSAILLPNNSDMAPANDFTISTVAEVPSAGGSTKIYNTGYVFLLLNNTHVQAYFYPSGSTIISLAHGMAQGQCVSFNYVKSSVFGARLYMNGALIGSDPSATAPAAIQYAPRVGSGQGTEFFTGKVSNFMIHQFPFPDDGLPRLYHESTFIP